MTAERVVPRRGHYADSVTLMQLSATVAGAAGVRTALVAMATELNLQQLAGLGFERPDRLEANELFIAVRAADESSLDAAVAQADQLLDAPARAAGTTGPSEQAARTVGSAAARYGAGLALISVPGPHAFTEAMDALDAGCDVLIFSDNVSVEHEILLKDAAQRQGRLVMGPDCGTAVVGGVGLGFAHTVGQGPVGLIAASGTGAQQLLCLLGAAGVGVSAVLGVGGRDLSARVGGRATLTALQLLDADPATELIVLVSKPPAPEAAELVRSAAAGLATPIEFALLGGGEPDLTAAAERVLERLGVPVPVWPNWAAESPAAADGEAFASKIANNASEFDGSRHTVAAKPARPGALRGLFCGGTLCDEAMLIAAATLGEIRSNIAVRPEWALPPASLAEPGWPGWGGHWMVDFGDDALTQGRAHPMIDPGLRTQQLRRAAADPATAVLLLDVVLGHGAHPDPVAELLPVLAASEVPVVISLIGARQDPQNLDGSAVRLAAAGAVVFLSNAAATRHALGLLSSRPAAPSDTPSDSLSGPEATTGGSG